MESIKVNTKNVYDICNDEVKDKEIPFFSPKPGDAPKEKTREEKIKEIKEQLEKMEKEK